jgi:hypothetical protein
MKTTTRLALLMSAVLLWPTHAHAARGFWGWLEELSGPGPFKGGGVTLPVACLDPETRRLEWCPAIRKPVDESKIPREWSKIPQTVMVSFGVFNSGDGPRFADLPPNDDDNRGAVRLMSLTGLYVFHVGALEVGPGAGFLRLSGAGFDPFYKLVLTPVNASLAPLMLASKITSRYRRLLRLELDTSFVPQGFKGTDFGNSRTAFDSGPEFITRAAVVVDFGELIR